MRTRVALALLYASLALAGAGAWAPADAGAVPGDVVIQAAPADLAPADLRQLEAEGGSSTPAIAPSVAALLWTSPDRALPAALIAAGAAAPALRSRLAPASRGARAPPPRTRS